MDLLTDEPLMRLSPSKWKLIGQKATVDCGPSRTGLDLCTGADFLNNKARVRVVVFGSLLQLQRPRLLQAQD